MEVEYHLTFDDKLAFERHALKQIVKIAPARRQGLWAFGPHVIVLVTAVATAVFNPALLVEWANEVIACLLGVLVGLMWYFFLGRGVNRGRLRSLRELFEEGHARWVLAPRRLTIGPEGFRVANYYFDSMNRWEQVWKIITTEDHAFFYVTPVQAQIVPRRAFPDGQAFDDFIALARQYHQGRAPTEWARPTGITTAATAPVTDIFRPDTPEPTP
jgi:hypothetical protein